MKRDIIFTALLFFIVLFLFACDNGQKESNPNLDVMTKATENRFSALEIHNYKGTKLDPSIGPRDNSIKGIQNVDIDNYVLDVYGLVNQSISLSYDEVLSLEAHEKLITLHCVEGWDATVLWKGVMLEDIIEMAGTTEEANSVIFHCVDGYTTSLSLQEMIDKNMILAYSSNNITLPSALGYPFIVVAEDKLGYKWARWVNKIELTDNPDYQGYWESRGYDNDADVPEERK